MQPNSLSLDPSFRFSVAGRRPEGWGTCGAQQTCPSAVGSVSGRTDAYVPTTGASTFELGRAAPGQTISPANPHDRVYEPYGQCVQYDLGNIFDPAYTMVCKLANRHLSAAARARTSTSI
jgi:hypothetical protein